MKHFVFYLGRGFAFFYRLNTLRLATAIFSGVSSPTVVKRRFYGRSLVLDVSRANPHKLLWLEGERFVQERFLLQRQIRPGMTVVDVGANIGYYALMFASFVQGHGRVFSMEPDATNLRELRANVAENDLEKTIKVLPVAAGDYDGTTRFEPGVNSHVVPDGSSEVLIKKIDSLEIGKVDFIKIDVEGYEGSVLAGAEETIKQFRPTVFLELHPSLLTRHTHGEIVQFLQRHYAEVSAYQIERANPLRRLLQKYGVVEPFRQVSVIGQMVKDYEAGHFSEPCWLVARGRREA